MQEVTFARHPVHARDVPPWKGTRAGPRPVAGYVHKRCIRWDGVQEIPGGQRQRRLGLTEPDTEGNLFRHPQTIAEHCDAMILCIQKVQCVILRQLHVGDHLELAGSGSAPAERCYPVSAVVELEHAIRPPVEDVDVTAADGNQPWPCERGVAGPPLITDAWIARP